MDDLIFKFRNKSYGAYVIRMNYNQNMSRAILLAITLFVLIICLPILSNAGRNSSMPDEICDDSIIVYEMPVEIFKKNKQISNTRPAVPQPKKSLNTFKVNADSLPLKDITDNVQDISDEVDEGSAGVLQSSTDGIGDAGTSQDGSSGTALKETIEPVVYAEEMPSYPGGMSAMYDFIRKNLHYPKIALENGIEGTVLVQFIVSTEGKIDQIHCIRSIGGGCEDEAQRVVRMMPTWRAGKIRGKSVPVIYTIPMKFVLLK
ncbi:MAG: energy transducer TonB [Saprospiraceae bacterium]|nr:energy transducer TonB [Saprospiraceae bacterium]HMW37858.1 energy transducer TonB [Saprospiraceae bacterium]HMX87544.1 energy transducer TonB [Saprospiraceae bacterium]HMZ39578.1 energy transducer TonB [Saprospiraceae bacterium]HNA63970.1 energy transducer TonB [Saprospiraceae bacterium]